MSVAIDDVASTTDPAEPAAQSRVQQAAATSQENVKKVIRVKLTSYDYDGAVASRETYSYAGRKLHSQDYAVFITPQTKHNDFVRELLVVMHRMRMGDFDRPLNQGVFRSMYVLDAAEPQVYEYPQKYIDLRKIFKGSEKPEVLTKILDLNWEAARQMLLERDCILQFDAWTAQRNWKWHQAVQDANKDAEFWPCACNMQ